MYKNLGDDAYMFRPHMHFASPTRLAALLAQEHLNLSVPQVLVSCCCEPLTLCLSRQSQQAASLLTHLDTLAQGHASHLLDGLPLSMPGSPRPSENPSAERKSHSSPKDSLPAFTASALAFLKSRSKILATVACLRASRATKVSRPSLSWKELRGRREAPLTAEKVAQECEHLLEQFPVFEAALLANWEPLQPASEPRQSLAASLCGQASLSTVLLGLHSSLALDLLTEAFEEALVARDWPRALQLIDVYGQDMDGLSSVRDSVLTCATVCGKQDALPHHLAFTVVRSHGISRETRHNLTLQWVSRTGNQCFQSCISELLCINNNLGLLPSGAQDGV